MLKVRYMDLRGLISKFEWLYSRPVPYKSHVDTGVRKEITIMLFLTNEPAKKAEINILTARDTTGPGY